MGSGLAGLRPRPGMTGNSLFRLPSVATQTEARSGMWLSRGSIRLSAASPSRAPRRSSNRAKPSSRPPAAARSPPFPRGGICSAGNGSTAKTARIMSSTPSPGSIRLEPRREEAGEMARVAARPGGAEADMLDPAVDAVKGEVEPARSHPLARQPRHQIIDEPLGRAGEIGGVGDRLGKAEAHPPRRRLAQRRQRLRQIALRLIEAARHLFAETAGERIARHRDELADPLEPDPAQPGGGRRGSSRSASTGSDASAARSSPGPGNAGSVGARRETRQGPGGAQTCRRPRCDARYSGARGAARDRRRAPPRRPTDGRSR